MPECSIPIRCHVECFALCQVFIVHDAILASVPCVGQPAGRVQRRYSFLLGGWQWLDARQRW